MSSIIGYNSHGIPMRFNECVQLEVYDRDNYSLCEVNKWVKKYKLTTDTKCIWVCVDKELCKELYMKHMNTDDIVSIYNKDGFIIPESDDGSSGYLFIFYKK